MKAPDKIYVEQKAIMYDLVNTEPCKPDDLVYISKDALLEWLQKEYETVSWYDEKMRHVTGCVGDTSSSGKAEAYQSVIDKLNSM